MDTFIRAIRNAGVKDRCTKRGPKFKREKMTIEFVCSNNIFFHAILSYGNSAIDYPIHSCYSLHLGSRSFLNMRFLGRSLIPFNFTLWTMAKYCALVFVCLMQLLSYIP